MSEARRLLSMDDDAALAEARRLTQVLWQRWSKQADWIGLQAGPGTAVDEGPSPFELGMLALFRYARGDAVPAFIVRNFLDDLLALMFAGLASGALALPSWQKMDDRPWAAAWRAAELRLLLEEAAPVVLPELAYLLGCSADELGERLSAAGLSVVNGQVEPGGLRRFLAQRPS